MGRHPTCYHHPTLIATGTENGGRSIAHVQYPSAKSLLYEHDVFHLRNKPPSPLGHGCSRSPVAYVDGHAAAEPFKHLVAVTTPHDLDSPMPFSHTINGIVGRDAASN
jgi:prepilin-type processing-associated H-X9-DG protein